MTWWCRIKVDTTSFWHQMPRWFIPPVKVTNSTDHKCINIDDKLYTCSHLTHFILVDSSPVICWKSPFVTLGVSGLFCHFYSILKIVLANKGDLDQMPHFVVCTDCLWPFYRFPGKNGLNPKNESSWFCKQHRSRLGGPLWATSSGSSFFASSLWILYIDKSTELES